MTKFYATPDTKEELEARKAEWKAQDEMLRPSQRRFERRQRTERAKARMQAKARQIAYQAKKPWQIEQTLADSHTDRIHLERAWAKIPTRSVAKQKAIIGQVEETATPQVCQTESVTASAHTNKRIAQRIKRIKELRNLMMPADSRFQRKQYGAHNAAIRAEIARLKIEIGEIETQMYL